MKKSLTLFALLQMISMSAAFDGETNIQGAKDPFDFFGCDDFFGFFM